MPPKENRRAARSKHASALELFDASGHLIVGTGRMIDFSNVGVCFSSRKVLANGDRLRARLRLLKEGTLEVSARVVWVKKGPITMTYGIAFDSVEKLRR